MLNILITNQNIACVILAILAFGIFYCFFRCVLVLIYMIISKHTYLLRSWALSPLNWWKFSIRRYRRDYEVFMVTNHDELQNWVRLELKQLKKYHEADFPAFKAVWDEIDNI